MIIKNDLGVQVQLIDMGSCMTSEERIALKMQTTGTPGWYPPEFQTNDRVMTQACDVFAYGLICFLLTGVEFGEDYAGWNLDNFRCQSPDKVNELVTMSIKEGHIACCGLTNDQLATTGNPTNEAMRRVKSQRNFLRLIAALATRIDVALRPDAQFLLHYFSLIVDSPE